MWSGGFVRLLMGAILAVILSACSSPPHSPLDPLHQATVLIEHAKGHGTGTIVGPHAVLTAYHVVQEAPLEVTFFQGPAVGGRVVWFDEKLDLALVDVPCPVAIRRSSWIATISKPASIWCRSATPLSRAGSWPAAICDTVESIGEGQLVPLGFPIGLGTSGGPVFDERGHVVGVALAILAERNPASAAYDRFKDTGIGLMLPAKDFCDALGVER